MEAIASTPVYKSLQSYWRRRRYQRVDAEKNSDNKRMQVRVLGDRSESRKGSWKLRALKKVFVGVKVKVPTPRRLLLKLRDSYVGAMHSWAGTAPPSADKKKITDGKKKKKKEAARMRRIHNQKEGEMSDFDKKMILHIYNTVMSNPKELMRISN